MFSRRIIVLKSSGRHSNICNYFLTLYDYINLNHNVRTAIFRTAISSDIVQYLMRAKKPEGLVKNLNLSSCAIDADEIVMLKIANNKYRIDIF